MFGYIIIFDNTNWNILDSNSTFLWNEHLREILEHVQTRRAQNFTIILIYEKFKIALWKPHVLHNRSTSQFTNQLLSIDSGIISTIFFPSTVYFTIYYLFYFRGDMLTHVYLKIIHIRMSTTWKWIASSGLLVVFRHIRRYFSYICDGAGGLKKNVTIPLCNM